MGLNHGLYNFRYGYFTNAHEHQLHHRHVHTADPCGNPEEERDVVEKHAQPYYYDHAEDNDG